MGTLVSINKENLDKNQYLLSLLKEGTQKGLLSSELAKSIPYEIMEVLKEIIRMYTKGKSSTLNIEKTESLMKSIIYILDLYLMKYPNPEDALYQLQSCNIKAIYKKASSYIKDYIAETENLYQDLEEKRIFAPNIIYNETFTKAIPDFFLNYDVTFSAHSNSSDIDYPLTFNFINARGITYIRSYLEAFELENEFCSKFNPKNITKLLQGYGKLINQNYEKTPINLFELVFNNLIFLTFLNKSYENLLISEMEYALIKEKLNNFNEAEVKNIILSLITIIIRRLEIKNSYLTDLIYRYSINFAERLNNALSHENLSNIIVFEKISSHEDRIIIDPGYRMNNKNFRAIYKKIQDCSSVGNKIELINRYVKSFGDFIDLLKADCFYEKEYNYLFSTLGDLELSALAIGAFKEYMLKGEVKLTTLLDESISYKYDWEKAFIHWMKDLRKERLQNIELLVHKNLSSEII